MSLDESMIDAYTIAIEQALEEDDRRSKFTEGILENLATLDSVDAQQEEVARIAADLAYVFSGVVQAGVVEAAARREAERLAEEEAAEQRLRERRQARAAREAAAPVFATGRANPCFCGIPTCTYDPTPAETEAARAAGIGAYGNNGLRGYGDPWTSLGYTTEGGINAARPPVVMWETFNEPDMQPGVDWDMGYVTPLAPLDPGYFAPVGTPAPVEGDPVLGTAGEEPDDMEVVSPTDYSSIIADQEFYPRIEDPEVQQVISRLQDALNQASLDRAATAL